MTSTALYHIKLKLSSSARLAIPEVVDRPCWNRVESAYWSGDFQKIFFLFDPSLTSGMSVVLMWGHCLRHRPYIKQHMSAGLVARRKRLRHRPPHLTATCTRVELMVSQRRRQRANIKKIFFEKLMNIQYLNLPPYPNRWMVWLIQQGLAWRPRCVKTCWSVHKRIEKVQAIGPVFNWWLTLCEAGNCNLLKTCLSNLAGS